MGKRVGKRVVITEDGTIISGEAYCYRTREAAIRASRRWCATPDYEEYYTPEGKARYLALGGYMDMNMGASSVQRYYGLDGTLVEVVGGVDECDGCDECDGRI